MAHRDSVINANGIELEGDAPGFSHGVLDHLSECLQMNVTGNEVDVRITDPDERLLKISLGLNRTVPRSGVWS